MSNADTPRPLDEADITWLRDYEAQTLNHFLPRFAAYAPRFAHGDRLLAHYSELLSVVLEQGRSHFHAVHEAHNEICVADAILSDPSTLNARLKYEPSLPNTEKTIDFVLQETDGRLTLIDVKTVKPKRIDRWDQYQGAIREGWLPQNVQYILEQDGMGGELWHQAFASRARFLEYTLELENKIESAAFGVNARRRILMFCGEGFDWHLDELEDFVAYYRSGTHSAGDRFALAEARYVLENKIVFQRSISSFGCLNRSQGNAQARKVIWHVQPSTSPFGLRQAAE